MLPPGVLSSSLVNHCRYSVSVSLSFYFLSFLSARVLAFFIFLREVFLSKQRIKNSLKILRQYCLEEEIMDMYSIFFQKEVKDIDRDVLRYAR